MNEIEKSNFIVYNNLYYNIFESQSFEVLTKTKIFKKILRKNNISFKNKKILEIGFGSGNLISTIIKDGSSYYGLEISDSAIFTCKKKYGNKIVVNKMSKNEILYNKKFDTIVMSHSLEHIKDEHKILIEISKKLNYGGLLILGVPSIYYKDNKLHFRLYDAGDAHRISKRYKMKVKYIIRFKSIALLDFFSNLNKSKYNKYPTNTKNLRIIRRLYYMIFSPIFSELYAMNLGKGKINEWWFVLEKI